MCIYNIVCFNLLVLLPVFLVWSPHGALSLCNDMHSENDTSCAVIWNEILALQSWVSETNINNPSFDGQKDWSTQGSSPSKGSNHSASASKAGNHAATFNPADISPPRRHLHTTNSAKSDGQKPKVYCNQRQISSTGRARTALLPILGGSHKSKAYHWKGYRAQKEESSSSSSEEASESSSEDDSR